ncbi:MAG: hypothetical protein JXR78_04925 [Victivallales bacterium]|nr:hypothetical protein [Victivallales bacterium]
MMLLFQGISRLICGGAFLIAIGSCNIFGAELIWSLDEHLSKPAFSEKYKIVDGGIEIGKNRISPRISLDAEASGSGTISFFIKPLDWSSKDRKRQIMLLQADKFNEEGPSAFVLYHQIHGRLGFFVGGRGKKPSPGKMFTKDEVFLPNQWYHILVRWQEDKLLELYVDGKIKVKQEGFIGLPHFSTLYIGPKGRWGKDGNSILKDIKIFKEAINPNEIEALRIAGKAREFEVAANMKNGKTSDNSSQSIIPFGKVTVAPVADGILKGNEYPCHLKNILNKATGVMASNNFVMATGQDDKYIYLGMSLDLAGCKVKSPDRNIMNNSDALIMPSDFFIMCIRPETDLDKTSFESSYITIVPDGRTYDAWQSIDWKSHVLHYRNAGKNIIVSSKSLLSSDNWTVELKLDREKLGIVSKNSFAISVGARMGGTRLTWKDHDFWYDHQRAFSLAACGDFSINNSYGKLDIGKVSFMSEQGNSGNNKKNYVTALTIRPFTVYTNYTEAIDDKQVGDKVVDEFKGETAYQVNKQEEVSCGESLKVVGGSVVIDKIGLYELDEKVTIDGKNVLTRRYPFQIEYPLSVTINPLPSVDKFIASVRIKNINLNESDKLILSFNTKKDNSHTKQFVLPYAEIDREIKLSMAEIPHGEYIVNVQLVDGSGKLKASSSLDFEKLEKPQWLTNPIALEALSPDWCPSPWQPLELAADGTVALWNRFITFDKGLISRIVSSGKPLLKKAIELKYIRRGKEHNVVFSTFRVVSQHRGRIVFNSQAISPDFRIDAVMTVEFDGMVKIELTIAPLLNRGEIDRMWLEYEVENAMYCSLGGRGNNGSFQGLICNYEFLQPVKEMWLGNNDIGLGWFTEGYRGWMINTKKPRIILKQLGKNAKVELLLVNEPSSINNPLTPVFGFYPTPVKPPFENWRTYFSSCESGYRPSPNNLLMIHPAGWSTGSSIYNPTPYSQKVPKYWKKMKRDNRVVLVSMSPAHTTVDDRIQGDIGNRRPYPKGFVDFPRIKLVDYFKAEWRCLPEHYYSSGHVMSPMLYCSTKSSWSDFLCWSIEKIVADYKLDGIYFDLATPQLNNDESKGYGWITKDGCNESSVETFATRDLFKRLYLILQKHSKEPFMVAHLHGTSPTASFASFLLGGEGIKVKKPFALTEHSLSGRIVTFQGKAPELKVEDPYDPVLFRLIFAQKMWGVPSIHLPQYGYNRKLGNMSELARETLSLCLLHDSAIEMSRISNLGLYPFLRLLKDDFGMNDLEFYPYWDNDIKSSNPAVKLSYYRKKGFNDDFLIIAGNLSGKNAVTELRLNDDMKKCTVGYILSETKLLNRDINDRLKNGEPIKLKIPPHDFIAIRLRFSLPN